MKDQQFCEAVLQSLEHEMGGIQVYETALTCALNDDLREEWETYLDQTRTHVQRLQDMCTALGLDSTRDTPGRRVVRTVGEALVRAMRLAQEAGEPAAAELVACEAVSLAETKDHLNWHLLGKCAKHLAGEQGRVVTAACKKVEDEEDEHLYHSKGWCRELWLQALGLPAVLPPPEERHHAKTAIGASRAEQASERARARRATSTRKAKPGRKPADKRTRKAAAKKTTSRKSPAKRSQPGSRRA